MSGFFDHFWPKKASLSTQESDTRDTDRDTSSTNRIQDFPTHHQVSALGGDGHVVSHSSSRCNSVQDQAPSSPDTLPIARAGRYSTQRQIEALQAAIAAPRHAFAALGVDGSGNNRVASASTKAINPGPYKSKIGVMMTEAAERTAYYVAGNFIFSLLMLLLTLNLACFVAKVGWAVMV